MKLKDILPLLYDSEQLIIETLSARVFIGFVDDEIEEKYSNMEVYLILGHGEGSVKIIIH